MRVLCLYSAEGQGLVPAQKLPLDLFLVMWR